MHGSFKNNPTLSEEEISTITISPRNLVKLPSLGETDIFRALQLLPGVSGTNDATSGLFIRGGTPDENLVLLDGMTVYHVDHFFGVFSAFNSDAIKDIRLYKGGFPAQYGGRTSSVVEMIGKTGDNESYNMSGGMNMLSGRVLTEVPRLGVRTARWNAVGLRAGSRTVAWITALRSISLRDAETWKDVFLASSPPRLPRKLLLW